MNKEKCLIIFCHEVSEILKIDKLSRKEIFKEHFVWNFEFYIEVEEKIEELKTQLVKLGLEKYPFKVMNLYFNYDERLELYSKVFDYIKRDKKYKNSILLLETIEDALRLSELDTFTIRNNFIQNKYFKQALLSDYVYATLASLWISFENDSIFDCQEYSLIAPYALEIKKKYPEFSIDSFDFKNALKFSDVNLKQKKEIIDKLLQAIKIDGNISLKEVKSFSEIEPLFNINNHSTGRLDRVEAFCALKILLSDGILTSKEKEWFSGNYPLETIVGNVEESIWFLSIIQDHIDVVFENLVFFSKIWSSNKSYYNLANILFLTYVTKIKRNDVATIQRLIKFLSRESSRKFKQSLSRLEEGKVIEEEILIILNYVFSEHYDLLDLNENLTKEYLKDLFLSLKESDSDLKHYAVASLSLDDNVINSNEYEMMWKSFASLSLNHLKLTDAFYDVSLLKLVDYEIGDYFTYLTQKTA